MTIKCQKDQDLMSYPEIPYAGKTLNECREAWHREVAEGAPDFRAASGIHGLWALVELLASLNFRLFICRTKKEHARD